MEELDTAKAWLEYAGDLGIEGPASLVFADFCKSNATKDPRLPKSVVVLGRRWFRKSAGNSYTSFIVLVDGKQVITRDAFSAYGDEYEWEALDELLQAYPEWSARWGRESPWAYFNRVGINYWASCMQVPRRKDL